MLGPQSLTHPFSYTHCSFQGLYLQSHRNASLAFANPSLDTLSYASQRPLSITTSSLGHRLRLLVPEPFKIARHVRSMETPGVRCLRRRPNLTNYVLVPSRCLSKYNTLIAEEASEQKYRCSRSAALRSFGSWHCSSNLFVDDTGHRKLLRSSRSRSTMYKCCRDSLRKQHARRDWQTPAN